MEQICYGIIVCRIMGLQIQVANYNLPYGVLYLIILLIDEDTINDFYIKGLTSMQLAAVSCVLVQMSHGDDHLK